MAGATRRKVKCPGCGIFFYRDEEENLFIKNRYWHTKCYKAEQEKQSASDSAITELDNYIIELFSADYVSARIRKQIKDMIDHYGFTYSGILGTLKYWYEVKGNQISKSNNGIGIVPYVYADARKYYETIFYANQLNKEDIDLIPDKRIITITSPKVSHNFNKVFDFDHLEERLDIDDE